MAIWTVLSDEENNTLDCYLNAWNKLYISVGQPGEHAGHNRSIALDKEDAEKLMEIILGIVQEME